MSVPRRDRIALSWVRRHPGLSFCRPRPLRRRACLQSACDRDRCRLRPACGLDHVASRRSSFRSPVGGHAAGALAGRDRDRRQLDLRLRAGARVSWLWALGAYLCGSIPFGLLISKAVTGADVRAVGSGNIGATNVARAAGRPAAIATLFLDALKGIVPVLLAARTPQAPPMLASVRAFAAVLGDLERESRCLHMIARTARPALRARPTRASTVPCVWTGARSLAAR